MDGKTDDTQQNVTSSTKSSPEGSTLEGKSNKELQAELVTLGMPAEDADKITTKSILISVINALRAKEVASTLAINPQEEKQTEKKWTSKAQKQWAFWDTKPKVRILVPLIGKEKQGVVRWVFSQQLGREIPMHVTGSVQPVTENGAEYLIPKGIYVDVPEPVAKIIQDKFLQTSEAGKQFLIDRNDPDTGKPVSDRL